MQIYKNGELVKIRIKYIMSFIFMVAVIGGLLFVGHKATQSPASKPLSGAAIEITHIQTQLDALSQQIALANEFGFTPSIVDKVQKLSQVYVNTDPKWRLIRTPENLTYIILSLIKAESDGVVDAKGDGGKATGLTQMWMATARRYDPKVTEKDLKNPDKHLDIAFAHFNFLLEKYKGNMALALYAWNRGEGKVDLLINIGQRVDNGYGARVYQATTKE
jgi:soluble lytic murein transglycosylase-like protein